MKGQKSMKRSKLKKVCQSKIYVLFKQHFTEKTIKIQRDSNSEHQSRRQA